MASPTCWWAPPGGTEPTTTRGGSTCSWAAPRGSAQIRTGRAKETSSAQAWAGGAVGVGDVNGDGYDDVLLSAPAWDGSQPDEGAAWLFLGDAAGLGSEPTWSFESGQAGAALRALLPAGDVNGDGYADLLLGAPLWDGGEIDGGAVFLFFGAALLPASAPDWTVEGEQAGAELGARGAGGGDLNGDGYGDLVVTAQEWDQTCTDEGAALVFLGGPTGPGAAADLTVYGAADDARLGGAAAFLGDLDGDGYCELAVAAEDFDTGRVWIWAGDPAGPVTEPMWTLSPPATHTPFGSLRAGHRGPNPRALRGGGQDPFTELVMLGGPLIGNYDSHLGMALAGGGDLDGDGYGDLIGGDRDAPVQPGGVSFAWAGGRRASIQWRCGRPAPASRA